MFADKSLIYYQIKFLKQPISVFFPFYKTHAHRHYQNCKARHFTLYTLVTFCTCYYCPSSGLTLSLERGSLVVSCFTKKVHSLFILWPFVTCRPTKTRFLSNVYKGMKIYYLDFHVEKYVLFGSISSNDFF